MTHPIANVAIQCIASNGQRGTFLYDGEDHRTGRLISPVMPDLVALIAWTIDNDWTPMPWRLERPVGQYLFIKRFGMDSKVAFLRMQRFGMTDGPEAERIADVIAESFRAAKGEPEDTMPLITENLYDIGVFIVDRDVVESVLDNLWEHMRNAWLDASLAGAVPSWATTEAA